MRNIEPLTPAYVSFDNGVCRRTHPYERQDPLRSLEAACENVQLGATLLNENLSVIAYCRRTASLRGGFLAYLA